MYTGIVMQEILIIFNSQVTLPFVLCSTGDSSNDDLAGIFHTNEVKPKRKCTKNELVQRVKNAIQLIYRDTSDTWTDNTEYYSFLSPP